GARYPEWKPRRRQRKLPGRGGRWARTPPRHWWQSNSQRRQAPLASLWTALHRAVRGGPDEPPPCRGSSSIPGSLGSAVPGSWVASAERGGPPAVAAASDRRAV